MDHQRQQAWAPHEVRGGRSGSCAPQSSCCTGSTCCPAPRSPSSVSLKLDLQQRGGKRQVCTHTQIRGEEDKDVGVLGG